MAGFPCVWLLAKFLKSMLFRLAVFRGTKNGRILVVITQSTQLLHECQDTTSFFLIVGFIGSSTYSHFFLLWKNPFFDDPSLFAFQNGKKSILGFQWAFCLFFRLGSDFHHIWRVIWLFFSESDHFLRDLLDTSILFLSFRI